MQNDADGMLPELPLVGRDHGLEASFVVRLARQHDLDPFRPFAHQCAAGAIAPLSDRVGDGQAVGKAGGHLAGDKTRLGRLTHAQAAADVAPEQKLGDQSRPLCAMTRRGLRGDNTRQAGQKKEREACKKGAAHRNCPPSSDLLRRGEPAVAPHQLLAFGGERTDNPQHHRTNAAEQAAQQNSLHQPQSFRKPGKSQET